MGGTGDEKDGEDGADDRKDVGADSDGGSPNHDACKDRQVHLEWLQKAVEGISHLALVLGVEGTALPELERVEEGTSRWKGSASTCLQERGPVVRCSGHWRMGLVASSGLQDSKSQDIYRSSRNFDGIVRLMEGSGHQALELAVEYIGLQGVTSSDPRGQELAVGYIGPPGVASGLVGNALHPHLHLHCHCGSGRERVMVCTSLRCPVVGVAVLDQGAGTGGGGAAAISPASHSPRQELSSCCPCAARCQDICNKQ